MPGEVKTKDLKFVYSAGDVVRLTTGQNAVIIGYGIYSGQYLCVKHYNDGIRMASTDYACSPENPDAYEPDIVGLEENFEKVLRVLRDYAKADADLVAKVAACNRRTPEPGTSVIRWTRYDGTPETLPEDGVAFIVIKSGVIMRQSYSRHRAEDGGLRIHGDVLGVCRDLKTGDLWAYLPEPPEGME